MSSRYSRTPMASSSRRGLGGLSSGRVTRSARSGASFTRDSFSRNSATPRSSAFSPRQRGTAGDVIDMPNLVRCGPRSGGASLLPELTLTQSPCGATRQSYQDDDDDEDDERGGYGSVTMDRERERDGTLVAGGQKEMGTPIRRSSRRGDSRYDDGDDGGEASPRSGGRGVGLARRRSATPIGSNGDVDHGSGSAAKSRIEGVAVPQALAERAAVHSGSDIYGFDRRWVTVFGFRPGDEARVLRTFQELFGTVINQRLTSRNYMHMQFETEEAALEAIGSNGQLHSGDMLGVVFCTDREALPRAAAARSTTEIRRERVAGHRLFDHPDRYSELDADMIFRAAPRRENWCSQLCRYLCQWTWASVFGVPEGAGGSKRL